MIVLAGGDIVLPDRILTNASLVIDRGRIAAIETTRSLPSGASIVDVRDAFVVPGFIDVHVHGIEGYDTLDGGDAIASIASRLPRYGVTAFCPTTVACDPAGLRAVLEQVGRARTGRPHGSARVLPAHLESNFINPDYNGAQPRACLRLPNDEAGEGQFTGRDILTTIESGRADVGIITIAPELPGTLELVPVLVRAGHRVSLGHSGADFEQAVAAIDAGARDGPHGIWRDRARTCGGYRRARSRLSRGEDVHRRRRNLSRRLNGVPCPVRCARLVERIPPLAAFAAHTAMEPAFRVHAGKGQLQRNAELEPHRNHLGFVFGRERRIDTNRLRETERQRVSHRVEKFRCCVRKRVSRQRPQRDASDPVLRAIDPRFREEDDVAAGQVDILIRRVECRRLTAERPVRRGIQIPDGKGQSCKGRDRRKRGRQQEMLERGQLLRLPGHTRADVDRMHV
jgi:hypothetical protein